MRTVEAFGLPLSSNGQVRAFLPLPAEPVSVRALDGRLALDEQRVQGAQRVRAPGGQRVRGVQRARVPGGQRVQGALQQDAILALAVLALDEQQVDWAALRVPVGQPNLDGLQAPDAQQLEAPAGCFQVLPAELPAEPALGGPPVDEPSRPDSHSEAGCALVPFAPAHAPAARSVHSAEQILFAQAQAGPPELCRG
jgi:hypothetical protein